MYIFQVFCFAYSTVFTLVAKKNYTNLEKANIYDPYCDVLVHFFQSKSSLSTKPCGEQLLYFD